MFKEFFATYAQPRVIAILFLGFSSGLPLALTASTLTAWLTESGIDIKTIGLFAAVSTPYALKFLWSPLIDGTQFPILSKLLGRRRGWLVATQAGLIASILALSLIDPAQAPGMTALMALLVAICSASQDIVIDAYRVEMLKPEQYGAGAATVVLGYRLGMIASSAGALFIAAAAGWMIAYWCMAALVGVGIVTVMIAGEPPPGKEVPPAYQGNVVQWFRDAVIAPFSDFMTRDHWVAILLFILLYKLADAFMGGMTNPFLLKTGFTKEEIASIVKVYGVIATIVGSFIGGALVSRWGNTRTLWICGIAHGVTNLMFVWQAHVGHDIHLLAASITLENITGGMGTAAFVAFMSGLCNTRFTATQYALISSFAAFGRTWLSTPAGWFAEQLGWEGFFFMATLLAIPGLLTLAWLTKRISLEKQPDVSDALRA